MPPLVLAVAAGVGIYAAARAVKREMRRVAKALDRSAREPKAMGTLTRDSDGVYRPPARPEP